MIPTQPTFESREGTKMAILNWVATIVYIGAVLTIIGYGLAQIF